MRQGWPEEQEGAGRRSLGGGVYGGNDVGGWGEAEGSGSPLRGDVCGGEREDVDGGVSLRVRSPCVRVGVQSRTESGAGGPDPSPDSLKVVH